MYYDDEGDYEVDDNEYYDEDDRYPAWEYGDDNDIDGVGFADPGGRSALRAATEDNPRNLPCPTCGRENMLTPIDRQCGYQCDVCADQDEGYVRFPSEY